MRTSAFAVAIFAITTLPTTLRAENDFAALLAQLSFGDEEHLVATEADPTVAAESKLIEDLQAQATNSMPDMVINSPQLQSPATRQLQSPVVLQNPVPVTSPQSDSSDQVDFNAVFALQDGGTFSQIPVQPACHMLNCCCGLCAGLLFDGGPKCAPHVKPDLPSSTLLQYFRSSKCHTNVWDGYTQPCCMTDVHLSDCHFIKKTGACNCVLVNGQRSNRSVGCSQCDSLSQRGDHRGCNDCTGYVP